MNEYQKEYIELRLIILGASKVGKKSFIERLLNISSTSVLRNKELELLYKKEILKLRKKYEKHKKFLEELQPLDKKKKQKEDLLKRLNDKTSRSSKSILNKNIIQQSKSPEIDNDIKKIIEDETGFILKVTNDEQYFSKKYVRPPIPEHPTKLYNIHKSKICIKPYYILPPEKFDFDYNPDVDDSENEVDTEFNFSLKGIKNDVKKIISNKKTILEEDKLNGFKIYYYNLFLFIYDMSDFSSFEIVVKFYNLLENAFEISKKYNSIIFLVGNKKDKKSLLDLEQVTTLKDFLKDKNFPFYEISTRSYYNFNKFFIEFILKALSQNHQELIKEDNFKLELEKITYNKPTFAKSKRQIYSKQDSYLGPKYYANIFGYNSDKELNDSFNNEKMRFNNKIFCNKTGPKYVKSKSTKDINININNINNNLIQLQPELFEIKGGLINKPIQGYQFGITNGKLNLLKLRRKLISERNEHLRDSIEEGSALFTQNVNTFRLKGDEYLEEAKKRREEIYEKKLNEKKIISKEIEKLHIINLEKLEKEKNIRNEKILLSQSKVGHNVSFPNLFPLPNNNYNYTSNININTNENEEGMNKTSINNNTKMNLMHLKNKKYLKEYELILKRIKANKKDQPSPGPNSYDIRTNISDKNKGFTITGKRKEISTDKFDPSFPDLKDEFDIIVSNGLKHNQPKIINNPRFKKIEKEQFRGPYRNEEIWKKWEINKSDIKKNKVKYLVENMQEKKMKQIKKVELIKEQTEEIERLRKEIQIRKGYDDPTAIKSINYSLVETSSPKITIKGRHTPKRPKYEEQNNLLRLQNMTSDQDIINYYIKNQEIFRPLPNANYVKPNLPNVVFGKAERFQTKEYQGSGDLFPNGVFDLKTQENFSSKSPYDNTSPRNTLIIKKDKSPSPAEYKIKSVFEIIAEKGKKMNEVRNKIKIREMLKNFQSEGKTNDKKYIKIKKLNVKNEEEKIKKEENNTYNNNIYIVEEPEEI